MAERSTERSKILKHVGEGKTVDVCVCSCSQMNTVQGLIQQIREEMTDVVGSMTFQTLPYNIRDLNVFDFSGIDVLLLCHSIENRRFSLTNVTSALYDVFLPRAKNYLGKSKVGVIAYDLSEDSLEQDCVAITMNWLRDKQETTFACSSLVLIGGQLSQVPVRLTHQQ
eukprot:XP_011662819.1 PREDICTED: uncharacterized protein LOC100889105 isoform X2 [Strongylocentrotus purpuratus]